MPHIVMTPPAADIEPARALSYAPVIAEVTQAMVVSEIILKIHGTTGGTSVMSKEMTIEIAHNGISPRIAPVPMARLIEIARKAAMGDSECA